MTPIQLLLLLAAQGDKVPDELMNDPVMWPYYTAIATLFGALTAGAGAFLKFAQQTRKQSEKSTSDHAERIERMADEFREAMEARSIRVNESFEKKDDMIIEISKEQTEAFERFALAIGALTAAVRDGGEVAPEITDMIRQVNELWSWVGRTDDDTEALRVYTPRSIPRDLHSMAVKLSELEVAVRRLNGRS